MIKNLVTNKMNEETEIIPGTFDNEILIIYKWANKIGIPYRFVIINPNSDEIADEPYVNVMQYLSPPLNKLDVTTALLEADENSPERLSDDFIANMDEIRNDPIFGKLSVQDIVLKFIEPRLDAPQAEPTEKQIHLVNIVNLIFEHYKYNLRVKNYKDLYNRTKAWLKTIIIDTARDKAHLENILANQEELGRYEPIEYSSPELDSVMLGFSPLLRHETEWLTGFKQALMETPLTEIVEDERFEDLEPISLVYLAYNLMPSADMFEKINGLLVHYGKQPFETEEGLAAEAIKDAEENSNLLSANFPVTVNDIRDIFDQAVISADVPYLHVRIDGNQLTKIYKGNAWEGLRDYTNILPSHVAPEETKLNVFEFTVWIGSTDISEAPKNTFRHGQYDVEKKTMSVKTILSANYDDETVISRLTQALPNLDLNQVKKEQIGGSFNILNVELNEIVFMDMI